MATTRVTFEGATGAMLAGRLDLPVGGEPLAFALFAHCFTCSKDLKAAVNISRELNAHRIAVFRFDFTGLGESEGDFGDTTFASNVDDLVAGAGFLEREYESPRLLVGHSLGGAAILQTAPKVDAVRAVVTLGAPYAPSHVERLFGDARDRIEAEGEAWVTLAGRRFRITRAFLEALRATHVDEVLRSLRRPLLILHSPVDAIVGIENAARIYTAAKHPKSFVSLDDADHLLTRERDSRYAARVLAAWASRYIDAEPARTLEEMRLGSRVVARIGAYGLRTEIRADRHPLVADEPGAVGGTDAGPTPYDLVAAGLGACTAMTLRMYADRKYWPLEGIEVGLTHRKVHADDERRAESAADARMDEMERQIQLAGPLDEVQRQRLLEIANRCPVHRTLEAGVRVTTRLADRPEPPAA